MAFVFLACNGTEGAEGVDDFLDEEDDTSDGSGGNTGPGNSALTFTPGSHDYGDVGLGGSGSQAFVIENTSTSTVFLDSFTGTDVNFTVNATDCPLAAASAFTAGSTCNVTFDFSPSSGGDFSTTINTLYDTTSGGSSLITTLSLQGSAGANDPTNYQLTDVTGTTATITWDDNSNNETGFEVERCDGISCATAFVTAFSDTTASNITTYTFTGLTEGEYYRFRVRAVTATSQSNYLTGSTMITFGGIASVDDNGTGTSDLTSLDCRTINEGAYVSLSWNAVADATAYFVTDVTGGGSTVLETVTAPTTSVVLTGLDVSTSYDLLVTVATSTGFNSQNGNSTNLTTTSYLPCQTLGQASPNHWTDGDSLFFSADVEIYNGQMFVADSLNNRVLIWNSVPANNTTPADIVIGQASLGERYRNNTSGDIGTPSAQSLRTPMDIWVGSVGGVDKMVVADTNNERVLIWNSIPTTNHTAADVVVGQASFVSVENDGGDVTRGMDNPFGVYSDGTRLFVADTNNNRVLIYNTFPTTNFPTPDVYLGQNSNNASGNDCGTSNRMRSPRGVWSDGTNVLVTNSQCHRVSLYESMPAAGTNPDPDTILGNTGLTANGSGNGSAQVNFPYRAEIVGGKVYVTDHNNNRLKVWNSVPVTGNHGVASDYVIGLTNTGNGGGSQQNRLDNPIGFDTDGVFMYIADYDNKRIIVHNAVPTSDGENADVIIGQAAVQQEVYNNAEAQAANNFEIPRGIVYDGTQFFVADSGRHRVLVWNGKPTSYNQDADFVLGQGNFSTETAARTQSQLNNPTGLCVANNQLWVADAGNRRVLVFDLPITTNQPNASGVLGQTSFTTNTTGVTLDRFNQPIDCDSDGTSLWVVDLGNDRVLQYDTIPVMASGADNPAADFQIGELGNATSQSGLRDPRGVYADGTNLYVADTGNHRVMVWAGYPTADDENADFYIGAGVDFNANTQDTSAFGLRSPRRVTGDDVANGKIYVLDENNERILMFNNVTSSQPSADEIYCKASFTNANPEGDSHCSMSDETFDVDFIENQIWYADRRANRVMAFPVTP